MRKYLLDPYIISILFQTKDDEETFATYSSLMSKLFILIEETIKFYLNEKKIDPNKINALMQSLENPDNATVDEDIKAILREEELIKLLTESIDSFGKMFYDNLLPVLPAEDRKEIARYLDAMDPIIKYNTLLSLSSLIDLDTNTIKEIDLENLNNDAAETEKLAQQSKGLISETEVPTDTLQSTEPVDTLNKPVVATIMDDIGEIKDGTKTEPELPEWLANVVEAQAKPTVPVEVTPVEPAPVQPETVKPEAVEVAPVKISPVIEKPLEEAVAPIKPMEPVTPEPVEEVKASSSPNLISQLQDMGINLDDGPSESTSQASPVNQAPPVAPISDANPVAATDSIGPVNPVM